MTADLIDLVSSAVPAIRQLVVIGRGSLARDYPVKLRRTCSPRRPVWPIAGIEHGMNPPASAGGEINHDFLVPVRSQVATCWMLATPLLARFPLHSGPLRSKS